MFVQMRAMSAYQGAFSSNPALACGQPLTAHLLQVTVDRLNRMTIRAHFDGVHQPGVRTHGRPAHRDEAHPRLRQDAGRISRALGGANNYSPYAQPPRPGGQTRRTPPVPPARGGVRGGGQVVHPCGQHERARARHPGGRRDARAIQRTSPVWRRSTRQHARPAPSDSAGRAPGGNKRRRGEAIDDEPVARGDAPPTFAESRPSHRRADGGDDGRARR
jgi:hypothetical protein